MPKSPIRAALTCLVAICAITSVQAAVSANPITPVGYWNPPLEAPIRLVNQYRQPNSDYSSGHRGVDYLVKVGQPVLAPADGQVWFVGKVAQRNVLSLVHQGGYLTEFEPACTDLTKGEPVFAGQEIAKVCRPDETYLSHCPIATCLHFSLRQPEFTGSTGRRSSSGQYLSPLLFIGGLNPSRLLPMPAGAHSYSHREGAL